MGCVVPALYMTTTPEETIDVLLAAVNSHANAEAERPVIVSQALVVWETATVTEDGEIGRRVAYTIPTDNFSLSGAVGLAQIAAKMLMDEFTS